MNKNRRNPKGKNKNDLLTVLILFSFLSPQIHHTLLKKNLRIGDLKPAIVLFKRLLIFIYLQKEPFFKKIK